MFSSPPEQQDWHQLSLTDRDTAPGRSPTRRLWCSLLGFSVLIIVILARAVVIESSDGDAYRADAARPLSRRMSSPGVRGRILARDGTVLAEQRKVAAIAVHYRFLEQPPNERWLRQQVAARLSRHEQDDVRLRQQAEAAVLKERSQLHTLLAQRARLSGEQWNRRILRIQARVERIAGSVNRRRSEQRDAQNSANRDRDNESAFTWFKRTIADALVFDADTLASQSDNWRPIVVAEQLAYHLVAEDVAREDVELIESSPKQYPGVQIEQHNRRFYPQGKLAAHLIGHLGSVTAEELKTSAKDDSLAYHPDDRLGRSGVEWREEQTLRGQRSETVERLDHRGRVIETRQENGPSPGHDVTLTIDAALQRAAETLLDSALQRRRLRNMSHTRLPSGGAVVVMDVHSGAILAAASAPRFDPNHFVNRYDAIDNLLRDPAKPLFDRVAQMAIPPGSVFKVLTAAALVENGVDPHKVFRCRGYLHDVDHWRCQLFRRQRVGHGPLNLIDAIARSCNVYFFDRVGHIRPETLSRWAYQFGFGMPTGSDWVNDSPGRLPSPASVRRDHRRRWSDDDSRGLAIGQGLLTTTPLQVVRMIAAIANGGRLVTPHVVAAPARSLRISERSAGDSDEEDSTTVAVIDGLHGSTLEVLREGLERVVSDPNGTAHQTARLESVDIAGKTGTAQSGTGLEDHSWFAGYAPADSPQIAFVVALEHAGGGAEAAGPVARRIVQRAHQLGYFGGNTSTITQ